MQADPRLTLLAFNGLKVKHDNLLSSFACFGFNCNLRHYATLSRDVQVRAVQVVPRLTPGLHS